MIRKRDYVDSKATDADELINPAFQIDTASRLACCRAASRLPSYPHGAVEIVTAKLGCKEKNIPQRRRQNWQ